MTAPARITTAIALMTACVALAVAAADRRETRAVSGFTALSLAAPIKVELTQGDTESLVLEGDDAALADLETVVEGGRLRIRTRSRSHVASVSSVKAFLSVKSIDEIAIAGSGDVSAAALRAERLKVAIAGSGDVRIAALDSGKVDVSVSGSGDVTLGGKAQSLTTSIAGSGDVKLARLAVRDAKVSIAGSGDATFWAKEALEVSIVGSGDVRYYGDPAITKSVLGSGSVKRAGAAPS